MPGPGAVGQVSGITHYSEPTCIVKIISHHSRPLIPPALGEPQQGQTEAELEHDGDTGRLEQHRTQSLLHWALQLSLNPCTATGHNIVLCSLYSGHSMARAEYVLLCTMVYGDGRVTLSV